MKKIKKIACIFSTIILLCSCASNEYPLKIIEASCKGNYVRIEKTIETADLYIDRTYLQMMEPPSNSSYTLDTLVELLFKEKLDGVETTNYDDGGVNPLIYSRPRNPNEEIIRASIKPQGNPNCKAYDYPTKYPFQALPRLRKMGLKEGTCVAIERFPAPTSKARIHVKSQLLGKQEAGLWEKTLEVTMEDASSVPLHNTALMVEHYAQGAWGYHGFPCGKGAVQVSYFRKSFNAIATQEVKPPILVNLPPYTVSESYPPAKDDQIKPFTWIAKGSNLIDSNGTVWVDWPFARGPHDQNLNILSDGKIFISPISIPKTRGNDYIAALARTPNGYAVIATNDMRPNISTRYIIEFNSHGLQTSMMTLTEIQYSALIDKK